MTGKGTDRTDDSKKDHADRRGRWGSDGYNGFPGIGIYAGFVKIYNRHVKEGLGNNP